MSSTLDIEHPFSGLGIVDYAVAYLHYVSEEDTLVYHSVSKICLQGIRAQGHYLSALTNGRERRRLQEITSFIRVID